MSISLSFFLFSFFFSFSFIPSHFFFFCGFNSFLHLFGNLRGCLDFFLSHHSSPHSIFVTHHSSLKIPQFSQTHPFSTHRLVLPSLFVSKKKKKKPKSQTLQLNSERVVSLNTRCFFVFLNVKVQRWVTKV